MNSLITGRTPRPLFAWYVMAAWLWEGKHWSYAGIGTAPLSGHRGLQLEVASSNASHVNIFGRLGPPSGLGVAAWCPQWNGNSMDLRVTPVDISSCSGWIPLQYGTTMGMLVKPVLILPDGWRMMAAQWCANWWCEWMIGNSNQRQPSSMIKHRFWQLIDGGGHRWAHGHRLLNCHSGASFRPRGSS